MDIPRSDSPVDWKQMYPIEIEDGFDPREFRLIRFSYTDKELTEKVRKQIETSLLMTRCAMPEKEFEEILGDVVKSSGELPEALKVTIEHVKNVPLPAEEKICPNQKGEYELPLEEDANYVKKFSEIYNELIDTDRGYYIHEARREELKAIIKGKFSELNLAADRLVQLRCRGLKELKIFEFEIKSQRLSHQLTVRKWREFNKKMQEERAQIQSQEVPENEKLRGIFTKIMGSRGC